MLLVDISNDVLVNITKNKSATRTVPATVVDLLPAHLVASLARYIMGNGQTIGDEDRAYIDLDSHKRT